MNYRSHATDWLNAAEIVRIRLGFARVVPNAEAFAADFYDRLFRLAPATRALFPEDVPAQRLKLKQWLVMLMTGLNRPMELRPALAALGERVRMKVADDASLAVIGQVLIDTLAARLGDRFTIADRVAWTALHGRITAIMTAPAMPHAAAA